MHNKFNKYIFKFILFLLLLITTQISQYCNYNDKDKIIGKCPTIYFDSSKPKFWVKSKTSNSISLHWQTTCHEETYSLNNSQEWVYRIKKSDKKNGHYEFLEDKGLDWFYKRGMSNILLEPSTTYFYKLELHHRTNGFLMQVGDTIEVTTKDISNTPEIDQDNIDNAQKIVINEVGSQLSAVTGEIEYYSNEIFFFGKIYSQDYFITCSLLIDPMEGEKPFGDFFIDIFDTDKKFLGRIDNNLDEDSSEFGYFFPKIKGNKIFKIKSLNKFNNKRNYQFTISQID